MLTLQKLGPRPKQTGRMRAQEKTRRTLRAQRRGHFLLCVGTFCELATALQTLDDAGPTHKPIGGKVPFHITGIRRRIFEELKDQVRAWPIHIHLVHDLETRITRNALRLGECLDLGIACRLLATELIAGEKQESKAISSFGSVQRDELIIVGLRKTSFGCDISNQHASLTVTPKIYRVAVNVQR